jgi:WD40 repeat protein
MISADGSMIASVEPYGSQLEIKDAVTNEIIFSSPVYTASGKSIAWSPTKPILAVTDGTAQVLIWNAETGETKLTANDETFWQVNWSMMRTLASSTPSNVLIWDITTWNVFQGRG